MRRLGGWQICLDGSTERCTISFLDFYRKIEKTMNSLGAYDPSEEVKYALAAAFAKDAAAHGMQLCTCAETLDLKNTWYSAWQLH